MFRKEFNKNNLFYILKNAIISLEIYLTEKIILYFYL